MIVNFLANNQSAPTGAKDRMMKTGLQEIKIINMSDEDAFTEAVNKHLSEGYKISSTDCGYINSDQYNFCSSFMAILVIEK